MSRTPIPLGHGVQGACAHPPSQKCPAWGMDTHHRIPAGRRPLLKGEHSPQHPPGTHIALPPPPAKPPQARWLPPGRGHVPVLGGLCRL